MVARRLALVAVVALPGCVLTSESLFVHGGARPDASAPPVDATLPGTDGEARDVRGDGGGAGDAIAYDAGAPESGVVDAIATDGIPVPDSVVIDGAPYIDAVVYSDGPVTSSDGGVPAGESCSSATPVTSGVVHLSGTTCDNHDDVTLGCNGDGHPDVLVRIDGPMGAVFDVRLSIGLAYGIYFGATCGSSSMLCGAGTRDGGSIVLGPFMGPTTIFLAIETVASCGPYDVVVARVR